MYFIDPVIEDLIDAWPRIQSLHITCASSKLAIARTLLMAYKHFACMIDTEMQIKLDNVALEYECWDLYDQQTKEYYRVSSVGLLIVVRWSSSKCDIAFERYHM